MGTLVTAKRVLPEENQPFSPTLPPYAPSDVDSSLENQPMIAFPIRNGTVSVWSANGRGIIDRRAARRPGQAITMAGKFFHPTHPRTHMHIPLTLLTQILISWGKSYALREAEEL